MPRGQVYCNGRTHAWEYEGKAHSERCDCVQWRELGISLAVLLAAVAGVAVAWYTCTLLGL